MPSQSCNNYYLQQEVIRNCCNTITDVNLVKKCSQKTEHSLRGIPVT